MAILAVVLMLISACGSSTASDAGTDASSAVPRPVTSEEAQRLAGTGVDAYNAEVRAVEGAVVSETGVVQFRGWIDTQRHFGYGLVSGPDIDPFLARWSESEVRAQGYDGPAPPLPAPTENWSPPMELDPEASFLAAAQMLLISLADTSPENPQLLAQDGARWWRQDKVGDIPVDVMSGPVPADRSESSFRYWVDASGQLLRLEARLDGQRWSSFTFNDVDGTVPDLS